jgi:hypothetical protein
MLDNKTILKLHDWIRSIKASNNYSYEYLGSLVNITDMGFSKALKSNKLSYERIDVIAHKLNLTDEFDSITGNHSNLSNSIKEIKPISIEDIIAEKVLDKTLPELLEIKELLHKLLDNRNAKTLKQDKKIKNNEDTIKETFQQILSIQNSFISEKNNRNEKNKSR